jgi:hypothetical protein
MYDIIGDVHGCRDELAGLVIKLGYWIRRDGRWEHRYQPGRKIIFVGDLVDRGPSSLHVIKFVKKLVTDGVAEAVQGNHDNKLLRYLKTTLSGKEWTGTVRGGLQGTIDELNLFGEQAKVEVKNFLETLPFIIKKDGLIVVHAAYRESISCEKRLRDLALYGEVDLKAGLDEKGYPKRLLNWKHDYKGKETIVVGHIVCHDGIQNSNSDRVFITEQGVKIIDVDWGACLGGELAAYRFPEDEFVSVKSKVYWE